MIELVLRCVNVSDIAGVSDRVSVAIGLVILLGVVLRQNCC